MRSRRPLFHTSILLFALTGLWLLTAGLMIADAIRDPFNPALAGTARYGHNAAGALFEGLLATFVEWVAVCAIVQPWRPSASWGRIAVALVPLVPWTVFSALLTMHAGGIFALHFFWLAALVLVLVLALLVLAASALGRPREHG